MHPWKLALRLALVVLACVCLSQALFQAYRSFRLVHEGVLVQAKLASFTLSGRI